LLRRHIAAYAEQMRFEKTVLQVVPELDAGGAERSTVEIAAAIIAAGGRALVASRGGRLERELEALGAEFFPMPVHAKNPLTIARNALRLAQIAGAQKVDILHARSRAPGWSAFIAARRAGIAYVATYHGAYSSNSPLKKFYNSSMARADLVIANSAYTASEVRRLYRVGDDRLVAIARGADLLRFDPAAVSAARIAEAGRAFGAAPEDFVILAPARLTAWKGQAVAVEAFGKLLAASGETDHFRLVLAGDQQGREDYRRSLQGKVDALGIDRKVRIIGHFEDMPAAYRRADIVVAPTTRPEAFGRVAVEAGAMERPVIASSIGGHIETVVDGETGLLTPPGDVDSVVSALMRLCGNPGLRQAMGAAARRRVASSYSVAAMQLATIEAYSSLLARRRAISSGRA
jgi:glycosyltransferase involved in cell wall biosynthesis